MTCSPEVGAASFGFDDSLFSPEVFDSFPLASPDFVSRFTGNGAGGGLAPDRLCEQTPLAIAISIRSKITHLHMRVLYYTILFVMY